MFSTLSLLNWHLAATSVTYVPVFSHISLAQFFLQIHKFFILDVTWTPVPQQRYKRLFWAVGFGYRYINSYRENHITLPVCDSGGESAPVLCTFLLGYCMYSRIMHTPDDPCLLHLFPDRCQGRTSDSELYSIQPIIVFLMHTRLYA